MTPAGIVFIELDHERLFSMVFNRAPSDPYGKDRVTTNHGRAIVNASLNFAAE